MNYPGVFGDRRGAVSTQELLKMPYNQRRIIVVTDDPATVTGKLPATVTGKLPAIVTGKLKARLARRFKPMSDGLSSPKMILWVLAFPFVVYVVAYDAAISLIEALREMRQGGGTLIPVSSAGAGQLHFPVGHPRGNVAYIGHPVDPPVYIPVADFHRFLFEHKVAEALRLIRSLGAVTVEVVRVEGWDQTVGVELGVALPGVRQVGVDVSASQERGSSRSVLSTMRLNPTQSPSVPADLVWLPHEPLWQEVVQARLESGLDSFVIDVRSTDDYGVNAGLKALVARAGLEAGGAFVEHRNTVWRLQGTFS
jgi:hypothetical protein